MTSILWLRRDLRPRDLPALGAAADATEDDVHVLFVIDPVLWDGCGPVRRPRARPARGAGDRLGRDRLAVRRRAGARDDQERHAVPGVHALRRWVPELAHVTGRQVHEPWKADDGYDHGYPGPVVDHGEERAEWLRRYDAARR
jgi:deoxyribodipyrimidine photolyase